MQHATVDSQVGGCCRHKSKVTEDQTDARVRELTRMTKLVPLGERQAAGTAESSWS